MNLYQILAIVIVLIVIIICLVILMLKRKRSSGGVEEFPELLEALGGTENIINAYQKNSRVSIEINDRKFVDKEDGADGMPVPGRLHQEDFAQALGIAAANKYEKNNEGYLKKIFEQFLEKISCS